MRLLHCLPGLLLVSTMAGAQPANYNAGPGPGYDPSQQAMPGQAPDAGPPPDAGQPPGPGQDGQGPRQNGAHHQHAKLKDRFEAANTSHDGRLTLQQAQQAHLGMVARNFDQIDADHKGYVTMQDVHAWHRARHQAKAQQQQQPPAQ